MAAQQTILVAITNSEASMEAVSLAATVSRARKARLYLVHVIEVSRSLPLNAEMDAEARRGEQVIRKAEAVAAEAGCSAIGALVQARDAGNAIVEEAHDQEAAVIVMGVAWKPAMPSFQVGRTVDFVMKNATCAVWVVRQSEETDNRHE